MNNQKQEQSTQHYIDKIRTRNENKNRKYMISTFGCQMNVHDSEKIAGMMDLMGYKQAENEKTANVVIYNTCCVRENAENKVYGNLGFLKNIKAGSNDYKIVLCGCMTQQDTAVEKIRKKYRQVDVIFGTYNLHRFPELLDASYETNGVIIDVWDEHGEIVEDLPTARELPFKASVNIMYGCNNFCTYCIVPYVRGSERSRTPEDILLEIEKLAENGVTEILLLGQNVNSYGAGLSKKIDFAGLLEKINYVNGIERIRFMTSHPKDLSPRLIAAMRDLPAVCKHLHLPFQSGSNKVLEKMNRKYTKEHYLSLIEAIKKEIPSVSLTTDIIVGFPGETEEDFEDTLDIVKTVRYQTAFTFYYSKRTGTPAASMENQVPENMAKVRFERLLDVVNPMAFEINRSYEGQVFSVLAETYEEETGVLTGRADNSALVHFKGEKNLVGKIVTVNIIEGKPFYVIGELV